MKFVKHIYDIDLIETYKELCKLIDKGNNLTIQISKEEYKKRLKEGIENYCSQKNIQLNDKLTFPLQVLVPYSEPYLNSHRGNMKIITPNLSEGLYIYKLYSGNTILKVGKIIIIR